MIYDSSGQGNLAESITKSGEVLSSSNMNILKEFLNKENMERQYQIILYGATEVLRKIMP